MTRSDEEYWTGTTSMCYIADWEFAIAARSMVGEVDPGHSFVYFQSKSFPEFENHSEHILKHFFPQSLKGCKEIAECQWDIPYDPSFVRLELVKAGFTDMGVDLEEAMFNE